LAKLSIPILGMRIFTGLDLEAQALAQKTVGDQIAKLESENHWRPCWSQQTTKAASFKLLSAAARIG